MSKYVVAFSRWRKIGFDCEEGKIPDDPDEFGKLMKEMDESYNLFIKAFPKAELYDQLIEIIKDPPVYSMPFLRDPAEHVQGYRKAMDAWYCKLMTFLPSCSEEAKPQ